MPNPEEFEAGAKLAVSALKSIAEGDRLSFASIVDFCGKAADTGAAMRSILKEKGLTITSPEADLLDASKTLRLDLPGGADFNKSARTVLDVANQLGRPLSFRFSGVDVPVAPGDNLQAVKTIFDAGWNAKFNDPEYLDGIAKVAARDAQRLNADREAVAAGEGVPGRSESELIAAMEAGAKDGYWGHWIGHAIKSLRNPAEMKTAANYYAREFPAIAADNLATGIQRYAPSATKDAWREALAQMPEQSAS